MILYATIILLIFDLAIFVVTLTKTEKIKKENEELKKTIKDLREINFELFHTLASKGGVK